MYVCKNYVNYSFFLDGENNQKVVSYIVNYKLGT